MHETMRKLKLFTDESLILPGAGIHWLLRPLLNPGLAEKCSPTGDLSQLKPFDKILAIYNQRASSHFMLSDLDDCDAAIVPVHWDEVRGGYSWANRPNREWIAAVRNFAAQARSAGKPVIIFFSESRSHEPVPVPGAIVFRHAMYRSRRTGLDHAMPVMIISDPMQDEFADLFMKQQVWREQPIVGFCGFARNIKVSEYFRSFAYKMFMMAKYGYPDVSTFRGLQLRSKSVRVLEDSDKVVTNFIVRDQSVYFTKDMMHQDKKREYRREFYENIAESDYQICLRGSANHSRRPWETLSCGRVPLFVDTDCVLPFEHLIDWSNYMPIVDESDLLRLPDALCDFHSAVDPACFGELQRQCRKLWEEWLSPHGFAGQLHNHFGPLVLEPYQRHAA